jgi:hypothetical protein
VAETWQQGVISAPKPGDSQELQAAVMKKEKLSYLAKANADLGRASVQQKQWMAKVAERAKGTAAEVAQVARKGGLSETAVEEIRERILGVAS